MRSVTDDILAQAVAQALDIEPVLVRIERGATDRSGELREVVRVQVLSVMVMAREDLVRVVTEAINKAMEVERAGTAQTTEVVAAREHRGLGRTGRRAARS